MGCGAFECLSLFWASSFCSIHLRRKVQSSNYFTLIATSSFSISLSFELVAKKNLFLKFGNLQIIQEGYDFNGYSTHTMIFSYFFKEKYRYTVNFEHTFFSCCQTLLKGFLRRRHEADQNIRVIDFCFPPRHDTSVCVLVIVVFLQ